MDHEINKKQYLVTGMTCAACQGHVERAVKKVPGVSKVSVALLTNSMIVEGTAGEDDVVRAVEKAGYGVFSAAKANDYHVIARYVDIWSVPVRLS